jgi:hypothetical protein
MKRPTISGNCKLSLLLLVLCKLVRWMGLRPQIPRGLACPEYLLPWPRRVRSSQRGTYRGGLGDLQVSRLSQGSVSCHLLSSLSLSIRLSVSLGHHEKLPYGDSEIRSAYHIREYNFRRLSLVRLPSSTPDFSHSHTLTTPTRSSPLLPYFSPTTGPNLLSYSATPPLSSVANHSSGQTSSRASSGPRHSWVS